MDGFVKTSAETGGEPLPSLAEQGASLLRGLGGAALKVVTFQHLDNHPFEAHPNGNGQQPTQQSSPRHFDLPDTRD